MRAALVDTFNELTREKMNEGLERVAKADEAATAVNKLLRDKYGIEVTLITVENPSSYQQYEQIVRQRKDTDQEVAALVQEQAQELAAKAKQVEDETKKAEIVKTTTVATNKVLLNEAQADKDKKVRTAEGYRDTTKADADAKLADQLPPSPKANESRGRPMRSGSSAWPSRSAAPAAASSSRPSMRSASRR